MCTGYGEYSLLMPFGLCGWHFVTTLNSSGKDGHVWFLERAFEASSKTSNHLLLPCLTRNTLQIALQVLNFLSVVSSAFMIWKGLGLLTNCESPLVVVLR
jgi:hypothetical protein